MALELPGRVRAALAQWGSGLEAPVRAVRAQALHVTRCFIGSCPLDEVSAIAGALSLPGRLPAPVASLGLAVGLPARRPNVVALALNDASGALASMQRSVCEALVGLGVCAERRAFLPHVTVARLRRGPRPFSLDGLPRLPPVGAFACSPLVLYRSRPAPGGSRYEPLASLQLRLAG